jgi:hypothetical protein
MVAIESGKLPPPQNRSSDPIDEVPAGALPGRIQGEYWRTLVSKLALIGNDSLVAQLRLGLKRAAIAGIEGRNSEKKARNAKAAQRIYERAVRLASGSTLNDAQKKELKYLATQLQSALEKKMSARSPLRQIKTARTALLIRCTQTEAKLIRLAAKKQRRTVSAFVRECLRS